jgi:hypothetical protein
MQIKKLAVAAGVVGSLALSLITAAPASADYAPNPSDVVGVGSQTVQYAIDFLADGDYNNDTGANLGNRNKIVNFDATPDANGRLANGSFGLNGTSTATSNCAPGTGITAGSGNMNTTHSGDQPCALNPTIVLRQGLRPVQRPGGLGGAFTGFSALAADIAAASHNIDFVRADYARTPGGSTYDSVSLGTDDLAMLAATATNAVPLTRDELASVYTCGVTNWASFGGSPGVIYPIIPQVGSGGDRVHFLLDIGLVEANLGTCVVNAEGNDVAAIAAAGVSSVNAIEPMSSGHVNMYLGKDSGGLSIGAGYFNDPSCVYATAKAATGVFGACTVAGVTLTPNVQYFNSTTPFTRNATTTATGASGANTITVASTVGISAGMTATGTGISTSPAAVVASVNQTTKVVTFGATALNTSAVSGSVSFTGSVTAYKATRNMYIYFRDADVNSTSAFQPGGTRNWVRTLFYNPCSGTTLTGATIPSTGNACTGGGLYGPGGAPSVALSSGQTLISASGIVPSYAFTIGGA